MLPSNHMASRGLGARQWSRRQILGLLPAVASPLRAERGATIPPESHAYLDRATEFRVTRLTSPAHTSLLSPPCCRSLGLRRDMLLYSSDRTGTFQVYEMDLNRGESRQVTAAQELDPSTVSLLPGDRRFVFFDGPQLVECRFGRTRPRTLAETTPGRTRAAGFSLSGDGRRGALIENEGGTSQVRLVDLKNRRVRVLAQQRRQLHHPILSPDGSQLLAWDGDAGLVVITVASGKVTELRAPGCQPPGGACWGDSGTRLIYLTNPERPGAQTELREYVLTGADRLVAKTTQYVAFAPNRNGSVFVAASGSKAAPYMFLLLRKTGREFTLCEHRASHPALVNPAFSRDSQTVFFSGDADGKPCLYGMSIKGLVETTDT